MTLELDPPSGVGLPYEAWRLREERRRMDAELDRLLGDIIRKALESGANVIQLKPLCHGLRVRRRVRGVFREQYPRPPASFARALRIRLRALATEGGGRLHVRWRGQTIALRVDSHSSPLGVWYVVLVLYQGFRVLEVPTQDLQRWIERCPGVDGDRAPGGVFTSEGLAACVSGAGVFTLLNLALAKLWPLLAG